jgi:hypothetical protein
MASGVYNAGKKWLFEHDALVENNTTNSLWLMLMQPGTPTFNPDSATVNAVVTTDANTECNFTGYTANGKRLGLTVTFTSEQEDTPNEAHLSADIDVTWSPAGNGDNDTVSCALLYFAVTAGAPNNSVDIPLVFWDYPTPKTTNSGDLTHNWGQESANRVVWKI